MRSPPRGPHREPPGPNKVPPPKGGGVSKNLTKCVINYNTGLRNVSACLAFLRRTGVHVVGVAALASKHQLGSRRLVSLLYPRCYLAFGFFPFP